MFLLQQPCISKQKVETIKFSMDTVPCNFRDIGDALQFKRLTVSLLYGSTDWMGGISFSMCSKFQKIGGIEARIDSRQNFRYFEFSFGQGSGFIKNNGGNFCNCFQKITALYKNTEFGSGTDSTKKSQWNGNDQCTRAGYNQENTGTLNPGRKSTTQYKRRNNSKNSSTKCYHRGIISGETGNEIFKPCFFVTGIFYKFQNLCNSRILIFFGNTYFQCAVTVQASADHIITGSCLSGNRFSGQCGCINKRFAFYNSSIKRNLFSRTNHNDISDSNIFRIDLTDLSVLFQICIRRCDAHHFGNGLSGFSDRIALEQFTNLIEQHDRKGFRIFLNGECCKSSNHHQKVFIKDLTISNIFSCFYYNVIADEQVRYQV